MVNVRSRSIERLAGQTSIFGFSTRQLRNGVFGQERAGGGSLHEAEDDRQHDWEEEYDKLVFIHIVRLSVCQDGRGVGKRT